MGKLKAITLVVVVALALMVLLLSQADATVKSGSAFDAKAKRILRTGGEVPTQAYSQWELERYKEESIPKLYPYKYAPWISYLAIDKYVTVSANNTSNLLVVDEALYREVRPEAEVTRAEAKRILKQYKVKGTGKTAYKKIRRYVRTGRYIPGVKSARGFFEHHGGDCSAHASAVYVLCKVQGIPVRYVMGGLTYGGLHAWNRVKLGKHWYWADETFDEPLVRNLSEWGYHKRPMQMW